MKHFVIDTELDDPMYSEGYKRAYSECWETNVVFRKQKPVPIMNKTAKVRSVGTNLRRQAIIHIIK